MAEFFTASQIAALSATTVRCDFLIKMEFVSQTVYVWNGNTVLTTGGNTYKPLYGLGRVDGLGYGGGTSSESVTMTVDGIPDADNLILAAALSATPEADQQLCTISLQLFDSEWQPEGSPVPVFRGFMQPPRVSRSPMNGADGATQSITLVAENIYFNRSRPPHGRNTDRDQQARSPGDTFFGFVQSILYKIINYPDF